MPVSPDFVARLAGTITSFISATGYLGVAVLMAIESACVPIPSEIIMPFAGYLVSTGKLNLFAVATVGALGCNFGSIPTYVAGKVGGRAAVSRWGRYLLIDANDVDRAKRFFIRFGAASVLIARMLPLIRSFIAFPAGIARMPLIRFHLYTFAGSWLWCFALAWFGEKLGEHWNSDPRISAAFHRVDLFFAALIFAGVLLFVGRRLARRHQGSSQTKSAPDHRAH